MKYASDFRQIARDALRGKWKVAVLTGFVAQLMGATLWNGGGGGGSSSNSSDSSGEDLFYNMDPETVQLIVTILLVLGIALIVLGIVTFVIGGAAKFGYAIFNLKLVDGEDAQFSDLFSQLGRIGSGIIMNLLLGIFTFLWSLLFIIPGIIKTYSYAMTPFILAEHPEISENEAITRSRYMMDGNKWRLFCLMFSFIGWELLLAVPFLVTFFILFSTIISGIGTAIAISLIFCIAAFLFLFVGQLFLIPYQNAALAAFYRDISAGERSAEPGEIL